MNMDTGQNLKFDDLLLRLGLLGTSVILFALVSDLWSAGHAFRSPENLLLALGIWLVGMGLAAAALLMQVPRRVVWLILVSLCGVILVYFYLSKINYSPLTDRHTDNEMIAEFAVETLKHGENPYEWNYSDMLRVYRDRGHFTPFLDGTLQHRVTYPALPTLLLLAFDAIGLGEVRTVSMLAHLGLLITLFMAAPARLRPLILLPMFLLRDYIFYSLGGVQDILWSLALVGVIITWPRPVIRALLFGFACTFRQQPWFVAPFLLIWMWHESGSPRERLWRMVQFIGIAVGFFVVVNLPFFIWDPGAWLRGSLEPSYATFNYMTQGFGMLTQYELAPFPRLFYSVAQVSSLLIMLIVYWFYYEKVGQFFWIFPGIFFWLYYRGLSNYWMYWLPPMLMAFVRGLPQSAPPYGSAYTAGGRWLDRLIALIPPAISRLAGRLNAQRRLPVVLITLIIGANVALAGVYLRSDPAVELDYKLPLNVMYGGFVNSVQVSVTNHSDDVLTPRFAVQPDAALQALPWLIQSGPEQLAPGESGDYVITASGSTYYAFAAPRGGQLVVTDAGGDYNLRATLYIPKMANSGNPDQIANADFRYWTGGTPSYWGVNSGTGSLAQLAMAETALQLMINSRPSAETLPIARLQQTIAFPSPFTIQVHPPAELADWHDPQTAVYGLEFDDGQHLLWILFGAAEDEGTLGSDNERYVVLPAPLDEWSSQEIDLSAWYDRFGWTVPARSLRYSNGLRYRTSQVRFSLMAGTRAQSSSTWLFGPIESSAPDDDLYDLPALVAQTLDHPAEYTVMLGDQYRRQRNFYLARDAYQQALKEDPQYADAHFGLAESLFWLGEWQAALDQFEAAAANHLPNTGLAYKGVGWSAYNLGDFAYAAEAFETAADLLAARPDRVRENWLGDVYLGAAWSWVELQDCERAQMYFDLAGQPPDRECVQAAQPNHPAIWGNAVPIE